MQVCADRFEKRPMPRRTNRILAYSFFILMIVVVNSWGTENEFQIPVSFDNGSAEIGIQSNNNGIPVPKQI